jgi:hypothetical protein
VPIKRQRNPTKKLNSTENPLNKAKFSSFEYFIEIKNHRKKFAKKLFYYCVKSVKVVWDEKFRRIEIFLKTWEESLKVVGINYRNNLLMMF